MFLYFDDAATADDYGWDDLVCTLDVDGDLMDNSDWNGLMNDLSDAKLV